MLRILLSEHMRLTPIVFVLLYFLSPVGYSQTSSLNIIIEGSETDTGNLKVGVFDNEDNFKVKTDPVLRATIPVSEAGLSMLFPGVANGTYAVAVYHDQNEDDQLNKKKFGIPAEGIGFSGSAQIKNRPPKFDEVSFNLENDTTIVIRLKYPKQK